MKKHTALSLIYKFAHENGLDVKFKGNIPISNGKQFVVIDSEGNCVIAFTSRNIWFISYKFDFYISSSFVKEGFHIYQITNYCDFYNLSKEELVHEMKTCFLNTKNFFNNIQWNYNNEIKIRKEKELKKKIEQLENDFNDETNKNEDIKKYELR